MIFVTVGTNEARFDRLLLALDGIASGEEMVVQHGPSEVRPAGARCFDYLSFGDMLDTMRRARVVVTHAGVGSVMTALHAGRRPVVLPRLAAHGEAVDDHQVVWGRRAATQGLVVYCERPAELREAILGRPSERALELRPARALVDDLREYLRAAVRTSIGSARDARELSH